jgi:molybdopterin converting factor small subunit
MKITVKLFAQYREGRFKEKELEITEDTTIGQIVEELGLDTQRHPIGIVLINV